MRKTITFILLFVSGWSVAQQAPQYSLYMLNPYAYNPSGKIKVGFSFCFDVSALRNAGQTFFICGYRYRTRRVRRFWSATPLVE